MIFKLNLILLLLILFLFSNATIEKRREDNEQDEDIEEVKNDPNTDNLVLLNSEGELRKREELDG